MIRLKKISVLTPTYNDSKSIEETLMSLITLLTPIIPHTAEEVYSYLPGEKLESVYLCDIPKAVKHINEKELLEKYDAFMALRSDVLKALEVARNNKVIGKSLNASVCIKPTAEALETIQSVEADLAQVFIVSSFEVVENLEEGEETDSGLIKVTPAEGCTCARCWQIVDNVDEDGLCERCKKIVG